MNAADILAIEKCGDLFPYGEAAIKARYKELSKEWHPDNNTNSDATNVPNPYQDSLRYGTLDISDLKSRILKDCKDADVKKSIVFTHFNEYELDCLSLRKTFDDFNIYISDGMTRDSVSYYS